MSPSGLGWIIIDSLDTLMITNLTDQVSDARNWIARKLDYDQDQEVNTFETTIRLLGGLLSANYLSSRLPSMASSQDDVYLTKAIDLADRLLGAYESASGVPYASINLLTGKGVAPRVDLGASSTAEATTMQLEMKYLSHLTGNEVYWRRAERVMQVIDDHNMKDGLLPIFVSPHSGNFLNPGVRLGSRGDSYYGRSSSASFQDRQLTCSEYLIKQFLQTSGEEPIYLDMWEQALSGIQKHMVTTTKHFNLHFIAELPEGAGGRLSPKMDHLVCFLPGAIAIGVTGGLTEAEAKNLPTWNTKKEKQMDLARELTKTCLGMYRVTETGLAPEIVWFEAADDALRPNFRRHLPQSKDSRDAWKEDYSIKPEDAHSLQRPETVESLFIMWRITGDPVYRQWGWEIFQAFKKYTVVEDGRGYTSLEDATRVPPQMRDNMESYWMVSWPYSGVFAFGLTWIRRLRLSSICTCYSRPETFSRLPMWYLTRKGTYSPVSTRLDFELGGSGNGVVRVVRVRVRANSRARTALNDTTDSPYYCKSSIATFLALINPVYKMNLEA